MRHVEEMAVSPVAVSPVAVSPVAVSPVAMSPVARIAHTHSLSHMSFVFLIRLS